MIHALLGFVFATAIVIMWLSGGLFAAVFLSIVPGGALLIYMLQHGTGGTPWPPAAPITCMLALAIIWTPRYLRYRLARAPRLGYRPVPGIPMPPSNYLLGVRPYVPKPGSGQGRIGSQG